MITKSVRVGNEGVAVGDGLGLPLIRQKSKIFATFPPGGRFGGTAHRPFPTGVGKVVGRETRPLQEGGRLGGTAHRPFPTRRGKVCGASWAPPQGAGFPSKGARSASLPCRGGGCPKGRRKGGLETILQQFHPSVKLPKIGNLTASLKGSLYAPISIINYPIKNTALWQGCRGRGSRRLCG